MNGGARSEAKRALRDLQRAWLRRLLDVTKKTPSQLAVEAGLADVTLTRFLNRADYEGVLSPLTIKLLTAFTGLPGPEGEAVLARGFEAEAVPFAVGSDTRVAPQIGAAVRLLTKDNPGVAAWLLQTDVLEGAGYLRGDIVLVDENAQPAPFDPVCVEVFDRTGAAETVFRIYEPPVLTGAARRVEQRPAPLIVDNRTVRIRGVVVSAVRGRKPRIVHQ